MTLENKAGVWTYLLTDGLGSVSLAMTTTGSITADALFKPFGVNLYHNSTMPTALGFTGQYSDATSGLDYYGARYYDPNVGQFISADTVQGPNRYGYVGWNPETFTDPTGQDYKDVIIWLAQLAGLLGQFGGGGSPPLNQQIIPDLMRIYTTNAGNNTVPATLRDVSQGMAETAQTNEEGNTDPSTAGEYLSERSSGPSAEEDSATSTSLNHSNGADQEQNPTGGRSSRGKSGKGTGKKGGGTGKNNGSSSSNGASQTSANTIAAGGAVQAFNAERNFQHLKLINDLNGGPSGAFSTAGSGATITIVPLPAPSNSGTGGNWWEGFTQGVSDGWNNFTSGWNAPSPQLSPACACEGGIPDNPDDFPDVFDI